MRAAVWSRWLAPWAHDVLRLRDNAVYLLDGRARWRRFRLWTIPIVCLALAGGVVVGAMALAPVLARNTGEAVAFRSMISMTWAAIPGLGSDLAGWQVVMLFGVWSVLSLIAQVVAPGLGALTIARDAERHTFESLLATPMSERAIVIGKLTASSYPCLLATVSLLPLFAFCSAVSEIRPWLALFGGASMAVEVFSRVAVGVACSAMIRRSVLAVVIAYAIAFVGIPFVQSVIFLPVQLVYMGRLGVFTGSAPATGFSGMMAATRDMTAIITVATLVLDVVIGILAIGLARRQVAWVRSAGRV